MYTRKLKDKKTRLSSIILAISVIIALLALSNAFTRPAVAETGEDSSIGLGSSQTCYTVTIATDHTTIVEETSSVVSNSVAYQVDEDNTLSIVKMDDLHTVLKFSPFSEAGYFFDGWYNGADKISGFGILSSDATFTAKSVIAKDNLKPIQQEVGTETVTFLPAYDGDFCPYKFYAKMNDYYLEIFGIRDMNSLSLKIAFYGAENIYTNTSNARFYGTVDRTWNDTFKSHTQKGGSDGLNYEFITKLNTAGVKTVYFAENTDTDDTSEGNWDKLSSEKPKLGTVCYDSFYDAYNFLLSSGSSDVWSSQVDLESVYHYEYVSTSYWGIPYHYWSWDIGGRNSSEKKAVILCKDF